MSDEGDTVNELALFAGAGGGVLGGRLLGWRTIGYVEASDYRQRILKQRMEDGFLHEAPLFSDIRTFLSEGFAKSYTGLVDVLSAGFPCQFISQAAAGRNDPTKNLWPETAEVIRIVRPRYILLENSPRIVPRGYIRTVPIQRIRDGGFRSTQTSWEYWRMTWTASGSGASSVAAGRGATN